MAKEKAQLWINHDKAQRDTLSYLTIWTFVQLTHTSPLK
jgi:hypothetical protein